MKKLIGFLTLFICVIAVAGVNDTVRVLNASTMLVTGSTVKSFTLGSNVPGSDGGITEATSAKVYVPMKSSLPDQQKYFSLYLTEGITTLFDFSTTAPSYANYIAFPLLVTSPLGSTYLYAAVKLVDNTYLVIAKYPSAAFAPGTTNLAVNFNLSPQLICDQFSLTTCAGLNSAVTVNVAYPQVFKLYFFQSAVNMPIPGPALPATTDLGGVYFEVQMSNRVYTSSDLWLTLASPKVGDRRLILSVSASTLMSDFKKMLIYDHGDLGPSAGPNLPVGSYTRGSFIDLNILSPSGDITVNKLSDGSPMLNNHDYHFSAVLVDKFKFATTMTSSEIGRPLEIEQLLKKQSCFLLTAGFGEEHYVITYFRNFRDQILAQSWLGRKFINFYYDTAPKYALIIYKSEVLRSVIRGIGYSLYFIFRFIKFLSIGSLILVFLFLIKRLKKWQQLKRIYQS